VSIIARPYVNPLPQRSDLIVSIKLAFVEDAAKKGGRQKMAASQSDTIIMPESGAAVL
jgi:hypothetical protein